VDLFSKTKTPPLDTFIYLGTLAAGEPTGEWPCQWGLMINHSSLTGSLFGSLSQDLASSHSFLKRDPHAHKLSTF